MRIKRQLVKGAPNTYSGKNPRRFITIHETGNTSRGADAPAHANLQSRGNSRAASWHWTVDDTEAIQSYKDTARCWHAGDGRGDGNMSSIGIEICVNRDGDLQKAVDNAAELTRILMGKYGIPISRVVQHNHWSGKNCPTNLRRKTKGVSWAKFKARVVGGYALGDRTLRKGMEGDDVAEWQELANEVLERAESDMKPLPGKGTFGDLTVAVTREVRRILGAADNGTVPKGLVTMALDYLAVDPSEPVEVETTPGGLYLCSAVPPLDTGTTSTIEGPGKPIGDDMTTVEKSWLPAKVRKGIYGAVGVVLTALTLFGIVDAAVVDGVNTFLADVERIVGEAIVAVTSLMAYFHTNPDQA